MKQLFASRRLLLTVVVVLTLILSLSVSALATELDPDKVFLKMPTTEDLNKEYDGKQPAWVDFDYQIDATLTRWVNDESKGEDGSGLVYLDIYRKNAAGVYEEFHMGNYPGNMEGPGFNMDQAGFFNYGPPYGERYFSLETVFPGEYKAIFLIPIYGTNTENFNEYDYVEYEVEFEITYPGIFTAIPELSRDADGTPVSIAEVAYDLSKIDYSGDAEAVETAIYWYAYDAEAENGAGEALTAAPSEPGEYLYRLQVTDGANLDENVYGKFTLADPNLVEPFYTHILDSGMFKLPPTDPSKVYDGEPVTMDDMDIDIDITRVGGGADEELWFEYIWYEPNRYGKYANMIGEFQGQTSGPSEPGTYRFQLGVHSSDSEIESHLYITFTIYEPGTMPVSTAGPQAADFSDVAASDWFHDAVQHALDNKLFQGVSETEFGPGGTMTRAMMATVLYRLAGEPAAEAVALSDVSESDWYSAAVNWAVANNILLAEDGVVGATDPVLREQIAYALCSYATQEDVDVSAAADLSSFSDQAEIGDWAAEALAWAVEAGLFEGKGENKLDPQGQATRAEVATLLMRFMQNIL